ncbi:hypothetical protein [Colwellia echini]|uniref:DUF4279 domain-containing protein n=1 Tax=Colwellia echini TaxID=1982103 RepID=A0ABY3MSM6_9GAMM|nr:hypothetical protein [Colwellia echini]TYK64202.1 hypothetical protein CWS31_016895 [Colwellia echini]
MSDLWNQRSVGLKFWGFDSDPYELANQFRVMSEANAIGEPHGLKNKFKENQVYLAKQLSKDEFWGDALLELIKDLGGIKNILSTIGSIQPKNYFIVINIPVSDNFNGSGNDISKQCVKVLAKLNCDISFNYI